LLRAVGDFSASPVNYQQSTVRKEPYRTYPKVTRLSDCYADCGIEKSKKDRNMSITYCKYYGYKTVKVLDNNTLNM